MAATLEQTVQTQQAIQTPGQLISKYQKSAPVDVVKIAEDLGINVWEMEYMSPDVAGKLFLDKLNGGSSGFSIVVRKADPLPRKRFTVAHELAHYILHRDKFRSVVIDDAMYRSGLTSRQETEANRLAAEILMPYGLIQNLIDKGYKNVTQLAQQLQVSKAAIGIRLGIPNVD